MSVLLEKTDVVEIKELWKEYAAAVEAGDIDRWLALWTPNGKQMPPNVPPRFGLEQIREGNLPLMELFDVRMAIYPDDVRVLGDTAYSHGNYEYALTPKEGGETVEMQGKFLTILARRDDGHWQIAIDCFNDNFSPAAT